MLISLRIFFQVDQQFYFNHPRLRISPLSEIISPEFGHIEIR